MTLPSMINASRSAKTRQVVFGGYNHIEGAGDGAIWDMGNMSSDHYPILAPRSKRKTLTTLAAPHGICGGDKLAWVDGTVLYYDGLPKGTVAGIDKDMVTMGAYLTIWPDKKYYNIAKTLTYISGAGEISFGTATIVTTGEDFAYDAGDTVRISGCATQTGNNKDAVILSMSPDKKTLTFEAATFTAGSENGAITLDRIDFGDLESTYVSGAGEIKFGDDSLYNAAAEANAITTTGDAFDFEVGDAVRISGATLDDNNSPNIIPIIREISADKKTLRFYENVFDIGNATTYLDKTLPDNVDDLSSVALYMGTTYSFAAGAYTVNQSTSIALSSAGATAALNKYYVSHETSSGSHNGSRMWQVVAANYADGMLQFVVIEHYAARYYTDPTAVTIEHRVPDLKHVIEHENRLWGVDESDETIRCCKLGNPFVWDDFEGLADGCWQATVGSPGDFTGAASYGSYPTLWKGLDMYEIYGYMPSNFQLSARPGWALRRVAANRWPWQGRHYFI